MRVLHGGWQVVCCIVPVVALVGCDGAPEVEGRNGGAAVQAPEPRYTVALARVVRADFEAGLTFVGTLEGLTEVDVVPDVGGRLDAVHVDLGDRVRRGQPVAQIRDDDLVAQVRQAEHAFEVARATLRQREVDLTLAETTRDRSRQLFDEGLLAREAIDDAQAKAQVAAAQVDLTRAQFAQNEARLDELRIARADATIRSPVDGFVAKRHLDPGAYASTNTPVVSVVDIHRVKLVAQIVERDFRRVLAGARTRTSVDAYPGEVFEGEVARVAPVLHPVTRTAEVEVEIPNEDFRLKPGMYTRVEVATDRRVDTLVVPRTALVEKGGVRGVFTIQSTAAGEIAAFVPVETGLQDTERVEILAGVSEGQDVITTGAPGLADGDVVTAIRGRIDGETS